MARNNSAMGNSDDAILEFIALPAMFIIICCIAWYLKGEAILQWTMDVSAAVFPYFAKIPAPLIPMDIKAEYLYLSHKLAIANPANHGWNGFTYLVGLWGYTIRLLLIPALVGLAAYKAKNIPLNYKYRRDLSLDDLVKINAELYPYVAIAHGKQLNKSDSFVGPWRIADDSIDFASRNGLLLYKGRPIKPGTHKQHRLPLKKKRKAYPAARYVTLNKDRADKVMRKQLGKPWRGLDALPVMEKGLAIALMAMCTGGDNRAKGLALIEDVARAYNRANKNDMDIPTQITMPDTSALQGAVENHENVRELLASHAFESTVFIELLIQARLKAGKVAPSLFLWLRPVNRTLWYTLHPIGGRKPWPEGIAGWIHHACEKSLGTAISTPVIEGATDSLEGELFMEQWVSSDELQVIKDKEDAEEQALLDQANRPAGR